jgi:SpoIIAA-like
VLASFEGADLIEPLDNMPAGVLGFEAVGEVDADDYRNVLLPALERAIADHGKVRLVYVLGDRFEGYSASAALEDIKLGVRHLTAWERCALVSDIDWIRHLVSGFGWMMPGKFQVFRLADLEQAKAWAAASD